MVGECQRPLIDGGLVEPAKAILQKLVRSRSRSGKKPKRLILQHVVEVWPDRKKAKTALNRLVAMGWVCTAPHRGEKRFWLNWRAIREIEAFL